jgi:CheY-like chemotaxis protein
LLEISRLDAGALKPEITVFALEDLFRELQRDFEPTAREKGIALRFVASKAAIRSDRRLMRRLLQNLVSNAIKYTPSGRVLVGVRRRQGMLALQVFDTGLGIPLSKQKAVFREFERLDQGARIARGLGLGLSIVERIARTLHHKIALRSTPGRGSCFEVTAPRATAPVAAPVRSERAPLVQAPLSGMLVVAIDNEPTIQEGMRFLLTGWGCDVVTAGSAGEAIEALGARRPDAVIADYHLDDGDGLDAVARLRDAFSADIAATLLTADRSPDVRLAAEKAGVQVLNKPLRPAALRSLLSQWRITRRAAE